MVRGIALLVVLVALARLAGVGTTRGALRLGVGAVLELAFGLGLGALLIAGLFAGSVLMTIFAVPLVVLIAVLAKSRRRAHRGAPEARRALGSSALEPASDRAVASAWNRAARLAPTQRQRLASAREACAYVLNWAETHPFDMDTVECAVLIRKRLPELVDQTAGYYALADRGERRTVVEAMVGDLERLGRMALQRVASAKAHLGDSLAATRAHIASRTSEEPAL